MTGLGTDTLSGIDQISLTGSNSSGDLIDAFVFSNGSVFLNGQNGDDTLGSGTRNDFLNGGDGSDALFGNAGNDHLSAGRGNDFLFGESGNDTLVGGFGGAIGIGNVEFDSLFGGSDADTFVLGDGSAPYYLGDGFATIADFSIAAGDKIQLFGSLSSYQFSLTDINGNGVSDTRIEMFSGDIIGVVEDVNVIGANVFIFAPASPIP